MRVTVLLLALSCSLVSATELSAAKSPAITNHQSAIVNRQSSLINEVDDVTIPQMLSYQGKLTDTLGQPVPNGNYQLTFRLYTAPSGGSAFWTEGQTAQVRNGLFCALLGAVTPITSLPDSGALYLSLQVAVDPELSPRLRIASAAYAYLTARAANADLLQGKDTAALDSRYVDEGQASSVTGNMMVDGTIAAADLGQMGAATGQVMKWTGSAWAARDDSTGVGGDSAWVRGTPDSVLYTVRKLAIARGASDNMLHGTNRFTHVNFGVACTTGTSGLNESCATVGGGIGNVAARDYDAVAGGYYNRCRNDSASGNMAFIGGGDNNVCVGSAAVICGGRNNYNIGSRGFLGGGYSNVVSNSYAVCCGGYGNVARGYESSIGGGDNNRTANAAGQGGSYATVPGGYLNEASGGYSFAAGYRAKARRQGTFVWGDSHNADIVDTVYDHATWRTCGGFTIYTNSSLTSGVYVSAGGNSWNSVSDSMTKENFRPVDKKALLEALARMRVRDYNLKSQDASIRHVGPVAQEFHSAFGFGESNTAINMEDADGVALAAIQALYEDNRQLRQEVEALKAKLAGQ